MDAQVVRRSLLSLQVCVPRDWSDSQVAEFANTTDPTGIDSQWAIRREGDSALSGDPERVQCESHADRVHVMLDC